MSSSRTYIWSLTSLPNVLQDFKLQRVFGNLSVFKVNISKSVLFSRSTLLHLQRNYAFVWKTDLTTYLSIHVPSNLHTLYSHNNSKLLRAHDLSTWKDRKLSRFGSINILKMDVLPCLLKIFNSNPNYPPKT